MKRPGGKTCLSPWSFFPAHTSKVTGGETITARYEGYIFDLDGTIYLGDELIPGARETLERLRSEGNRKR